MAFVANLAERFLSELKEPNNKKKIGDTFLNPLITHIMSQIYPYIITIMIVQVVLVLLIGVLMYYLLKIRFRSY